MEYIIENEKINAARQLVQSLPTTFEGFPEVTSDDFNYGMPSDAFDSVVTYLIELTTNQIKSGKTTNTITLTIRDNLEKLLPEENMFGAGMSKKQVLNQIYTQNSRYTN